MVAYEFYRVDKAKGSHLIGILPERRENSNRITEESAIEWVKNLLGDGEDLSNIFFVKVTFSGFEEERGREDPDS
ncbi:MAG: hypothetical protein A2W09_02680 [Deltaproteobacteria bacterium RBG_16_50_11]|nr:MAG: hypothetical protein A2W09_02680 [Deltaproteobacteria bacterium RBG_16_50_11]